MSITTLIEGIQDWEQKGNSAYAVFMVEDTKECINEIRETLEDKYNIEMNPTSGGFVVVDISRKDIKV